MLRGEEENLSFPLCFSAAFRGASAVNWGRAVQIYRVN
jgi:hypothetical protein